MSLVCFLNSNVIFKLLLDNNIIDDIYINNNYIIKKQPQYIIRLLVLNYLYEFKHKKLTQKELKYIFDLSKSIELSCYNEVIDFCDKSEKSIVKSWNNNLFVNLYSIKCGIILELLNPNSLTNKSYNLNLIENIFNKNIKATEIASFSIIKLCPQSIEEEQKIINIRQNQKIIAKGSNLYKCPNCHKSNCTFESVQRRGLDEAETIKCTCLECGKKYTI